MALRGGEAVDVDVSNVRSTISEVGDVSVDAGLRFVIRPPLFT